MSKKQSTQLTAFYQSYQAWLGGGAALNSLIYERCEGLCRSLGTWARHMELDPVLSIELGWEMRAQFQDAGLDELYPWGYAEYERESRDYVCHKNPQRTTWVMEHAHV